MHKISIKNIFLILLLVVAILTSLYLNIKDSKDDDDVPIPDTTYLSDDINKYLHDRSGTLDITYVLPNYIYLSMDSLYEQFFSELFYYSYNYSDKSAAYLAKYGIRSLHDTLLACKTWTGGARGFPNVGLAFGPYFLKPKSHGTFNDARNTKTFVGHCINNDKFVDILYFLKTFFYYWRMDEVNTISFDDKGYSGATDFFLYPDISLIDSVKFFYYYTHDIPYNIYLKGNIPNLYDEIPGLLKEPFNKTATYRYERGIDSTFTFPKNFDCYGFTFQGWYDNEDFDGEPVSMFSKYDAIDYGSKITLYAKFERTGRFAVEIKKDNWAYYK